MDETAVRTVKNVAQSDKLTENYRLTLQLSPPEPFYIFLFFWLSSLKCKGSGSVLLLPSLLLQPWQASVRTFLKKICRPAPSAKQKLLLSADYSGAFSSWRDVNLLQEAVETKIRVKKERTYWTHICQVTINMTPNECQRCSVSVGCI